MAASLRSIRRSSEKLGFYGQWLNGVGSLAQISKEGRAEHDFPDRVCEFSLSARRGGPSLPTDEPEEAPVSSFARRNQEMRTIILILSLLSAVAVLSATPAAAACPTGYVACGEFCCGV
jgi:hypothetical protein